MSDLNAEEIAKLVEAFNKLKVKPKADTPEDLEIGLRHLVRKQKLKKNQSQLRVLRKQKVLSHQFTNPAFHSFMEIVQKERQVMHNGCMRSDVLPLRRYIDQRS